jgi:hypothetical protein
MAKYAFIGDAYEAYSKNADASTCVNLYPETVESGSGKNRRVLRGVPGLTQVGTLGSGPVRGLFAGEDRLFAVSGTTLYEVSSGGSGSSMGTVANDGKPAYMFPNGNQLFVISGGEASIHTGVSLVSAPVPAVDGASGAAGTVGTASSGCYIDGYFVAAKEGTKQFFISALNDGLTWDELDFASKEGYPDSIRFLMADHRELWLFGSHKSLEVWRNEGDPDFPFRPDPGAFQHYGLAAKHSVCNFAGGVGWLGGDTRGRVSAFRSQGFQAVRISTHAVEEQWRGLDIEDAVGYSYVDGGHTFYVLTFPGAATWVYDLTENAWHRRGRYSEGGWSSWPGWVHAYCFGKHFVGDSSTGALYEMSSDIFTDDGDPIRYERTAPHLCNEQKNQFHHRLQVDMETGTGSDEVFASLEFSEDSGRTWSDPIQVSAGDAGEYTKRVVWRRLGRSRDRVYRVTVESSSKLCLIDGYFEATGGHA